MRLADLTGAWRRRRALESGLDGRQPAKKPPGQAGVVGEDDALSLGNHGGYIVDWNGSDNEGGLPLPPRVLASGGEGQRRPSAAVLSLRTPMRSIGYRWGDKFSDAKEPPPRQASLTRRLSTLPALRGGGKEKKQKGPNAGPLKQNRLTPAPYFGGYLAAASLPGALVVSASMRAALPRRPRR